ncbi:MAG: hypothetical protein J3Q66DRAFT_399753 [Benniella sp.]|nr:MAG: hypothetical protein J3Q66DRAFT_408220 [Benniella sp.]KAK3820360.1 MAG: hypothetical protein J3Q66DRAFT_399753 [Benniella sp.]
MSKLLLKVKHGTKRPLPKRPLPLKVDKHRDKHRLGVTTSPRGSNTRMPYHARRQQQYQQETTHPQKIITRPQDDILKQIEFQQRPCLPGPLNEIQCRSKEHFEIMVAKDDKNRQRSIPWVNVPDFA